MKNSDLLKANGLSGLINTVSGSIVPVSYSDGMPEMCGSFDDSCIDQFDVTDGDGKTLASFNADDLEGAINAHLQWKDIGSLNKEPFNWHGFTSIRQVRATLERTKCEQTTREALLANSEMMASKARDVGESVPDLHKLISTNYANAKRVVERLVQFLDSNEAHAQEAIEKERSSKIVFNDLDLNDLDEVIGEAIDAEYEDLGPSGPSMSP